MSSMMQTDSVSDLLRSLKHLLPIFFPAPPNPKPEHQDLYITGKEHGYWIIEQKVKELQNRPFELCAVLHWYMGDIHKNSPTVQTLTMKRVPGEGIVQWTDESYQKILDIFEKKIKETVVNPDPAWSKEEWLNSVSYWDHDVLWVEGYGFVMTNNKTLYIYKTYEDLHK